MTEESAITYTTLPELGAAVPRRGNRLSRSFFRMIMRLLGWRVAGQVPDLPRFVLVGAPHTSNLDFFITAVTMASLGIDVRFVMKHTPFVGPVGWFLRWFGGIPLDRDKSRGFVSQMLDEFAERDSFLLGIMPEGTRGKDNPVKGWHSGFYHIARGAAVPLVMVAFDFGTHVMRVGPAMTPSPHRDVSSDSLYEAELPVIQSYFVGVEGRNRERMMEL